MTSNEGIDKLNQTEKNIGFLKNKNTEIGSDAFLKKGIKEKFKPEFLNRIDKIITFKSLTREENLKILDLELSDIQERILKSYKKVILSYTSDFKEYVLDKTFSKEYGARFMKRYLEKEIVIRLSNIIFMEEIDDTDVILVDVKEEKFIFEKLDKKKLKNNKMTVTV
jgi:ATP-dependent Clp protease ATP-binding subunit ClpB